MTPPDDSVIAALAQVPTGVLADVLYEMGLKHQVVSAELRPLSQDVSFVGRAVCVAGRSEADATAMSSPLATMFDVDAVVAAGSVVVVDAGDHRVGATIGGLVARTFKKAGAVGFVTDGGVRDRAELMEMGLPSVARFVTPRAAKGVWAVTAVGGPVTLPGQAGTPVAVAPGDILCCDMDGLVVVPAGVAADVLADASKVEDAERQILKVIEAGGDRREAYRRYDRFGHIRKRYRG
ncbi:MAG: hypothetical protein JWO51_4104 [Rhodospirillales bacterium]|jgi:4-hydroxy-4-methyl-2-oxoglutarate aldolase|nr:hypothetical protein [Rhodospirillales bacterium]